MTLVFALGVIYFMNQETQQLQNEIKVFICTTKWVCWSLMNSGCAVLLDEGSGRQPPIVISTTRIIMCLSCLHPFLIAGFTKTKCFLKSIGPVTKNILPIQWKNRNSWLGISSQIFFKYKRFLVTSIQVFWQEPLKKFLGSLHVHALPWSCIISMFLHY